MNNNLKNDYVTGLITGRMVKVEDFEGRISEEFIPNKSNPHPPISDIIKMTKESRQRILERESLINPALKINKEEFSKTEMEKRALKKVIKDYKKASQKNSTEFQKEKAEFRSSLQTIPNWGCTSKVIFS